MRALLKLIVLLVLLSPVMLAALAWFALQDQALVTDGAVLSHQDIARARGILEANDPRRLPPNAPRLLEISAHDLDLAANYLAHGAGARVRTSLAMNRVTVRASKRIDFLPWLPFVNVDARLRAGEGRLTIDRLSIGRISIPGPLGDRAARLALSLLPEHRQIENALQLIDDVQVFPDLLRINYRWRADLIENARETLLTRVDRSALRFYHDHLADLQRSGIGTRGSLIPLLTAFFDAAAKRSVGADPVVENVALLTVLGTWASRQDLRKLVPDSRKHVGNFRIKLQQRYDFAQHFLTSAALAARGDSALSDAVGLFKEISDTDNGSGFSFTDIAADRAGTRFGSLATKSREDALRLQQQMAAGVAEKDIMPPAKDLPEHMDASNFKNQFDHVGSPAYTAMMEEIDRRIDTCRLYSY